MMANLQRKTSAIVSGSAAGIGAACAILLAERGFNVTVNYCRSESEAEATAWSCRKAGSDAIVVRGDISDDSDCRRIVEDSVCKWGGLDVLVNNAGITRFADPGNLDTLDKEDFDRIMSVNLVGTYQLTRAAVPYLRKSDNASVVNVSSHSAFSGIGSSMAYAASKGALNTLTLSLARALAPEIRVNAVCPGFVNTNWMSGKLDEDELSKFKAKVAAVAPLQRLVSPRDTAEAVSWFALGGKAITGQFLVIDGGTHLTIGNPL